MPTDPNDPNVYARAMLVNHHEYLKPAASVDELVAFANALRDGDSTIMDTRRGDGGNTIKLTSTTVDSDEVYDDISISSSSEEEDSDQVIFA